MERERDASAESEGEELLAYDHTDESFEADPDVDTVDRGEFEGVNITESDGPDLETGDDLDTGAAISDRRHRE